MLYTNVYLCLTKIKKKSHFELGYKTTIAMLLFMFEQVYVHNNDDFSFLLRLLFIVFQ